MLIVKGNGQIVLRIVKKKTKGHGLKRPLNLVQEHLARRRKNVSMAKVSVVRKAGSGIRKKISVSN
tara:strand:+ start:634 stop:831 length:198 start_codon:yes stop_codon:yes gene_type:complete